MEESCETCARRYRLRKSVYSRGGCETTDMDGYICMCFAKDGVAVWMTGNIEEYGICEAYQPRETSETKRCKDCASFEREWEYCFRHGNHAPLNGSCQHWREEVKLPKEDMRGVRNE